jgi:hypothetical protein
MSRRQAVQLAHEARESSTEIDEPHELPSFEPRPCPFGTERRDLDEGPVHS